MQAGSLNGGATHQTCKFEGKGGGTCTSGHICFYADGTDCRLRRCERPMKWQQPKMPGGRDRRSSGFDEVAGLEGHRLDKLAWSRRCAMLLGSACPWKSEHVCVAGFEMSRYLDNVTEPFHRQSKGINLAPYHLPGCKWEKEVRWPGAAACLIAVGSCVQSPVGLAAVRKAAPKVMLEASAGGNLTA